MYKNVYLYLDKLYKNVYAMQCYVCVYISQNFHSLFLLLLHSTTISQIGYSFNTGIIPKWSGELQHERLDSYGTFLECLSIC